MNKSVIMKNLIKICVCCFVFSFTSFSKTDYLDTIKSDISKEFKISSNDIKLSKFRHNSNRQNTYSFKIKDKKYVLHIFPKKYNDSQRENDIQKIKILSEMGISPKVIFIDKEGRYYIREFLEGHLLESKDLKNNDIIKNLAIILRKINSKNIEGEKKTQDHIDIAGKYYKNIETKNIALPSSFKAVYEQYLSHSKNLESKIGLSCMFLKPSSILVGKDNSIYIMDIASGIEYSNIYEEIGYTTLLSGIIDDEKLKIFAMNYFGEEFNDKSIGIIKKFQKRAGMMISLLYFSLSENKADKKIPYEERVKKLDELLNDKDLKSFDVYFNENQIINEKSRNKDEVKKYALSFFKLCLQN